VRATFALHDAEGSASSSVDHLGETGLVRRLRADRLQDGRRSIRVPVSDQHGEPVLPGLYRLRLTATDAVGNRRISGDLPLRVEHAVRSTVWTNVSGAGHRVALTFDDCNDRAAWDRILGLLAANHLHATFFCIGENVERYAATARRTVALGDAVGDHTWDHPSLPGMSEAAVETELRKQADAWWKVARVTPVPYFRPPYGAYDATTLAAAGRLGFVRTMLWDVDLQDCRPPGASVLAATVLGAIYPGAIVVMHVQAQTARALPSILAGLRRRGLVQSSLPELFGAAGMA